MYIYIKLIVESKQENKLIITKKGFITKKKKQT